MKRIKFLIIIFLLIFISKVNAQDLELNDKVIEFDGIRYFGLQGFTITNKYLFLTLIGNNDSSSIIKVYDMDNYKLVKEYNYDSLGHANDMTYNSNSNMIYILEGGGSTFVNVFDGSSFEYIDKINTKLPIRSITYVDKLDKYLARTFSVGFVFDNELNLDSKIPFIMGLNINEDIGRQGWTYYNDYLYYANWSWVRLGGDGRNIIYVYNLDGHNVDTLYTACDIGELEDIAFYNSKMVLGFNGYDGKIKFYVVDIPTIKANDEEAIVEKDEFKEEDKFDKKIIGYSLVIIVIILGGIYLIRKKLSK